MANLFTEIVFSVLLVFMILALCVSIIISFALKYAFFQKIYLFIFEHDDWNVYRETKRILKRGEEIPILPFWYDLDKRNGLCFIVSLIDDKRYVSIWKDNDCKLVYGFHKLIIDDLLDYGNLKEQIKQKQIEFTEYWGERTKEEIELEKKLVQLKAEYKEKFGVDYDEEHKDISK